MMTHSITDGWNSKRVHYIKRFGSPKTICGKARTRNVGVVLFIGAEVGRQIGGRQHICPKCLEMTK